MAGVVSSFFSAKHELGETLSSLPPLWDTLLSPTQAAAPWLLQLLPLVTSGATVQFPGNDSSYLNHDPSGWYFVPPLMVHGWRKKETSPELRCPWILNTQLGGAQTWGTVAEMHWAPRWLQLQHSFVKWVVFRGRFRSSSNSTANLHWNRRSFVWQWKSCSQQNPGALCGFAVVLHSPMSCPCLALLLFPELVILTGNWWPDGWCCFV